MNVALIHTNENESFKKIVNRTNTGGVIKLQELDGAHRGVVDQRVGRVFHGMAAPQTMLLVLPGQGVHHTVRQGRLRSQKKPSRNMFMVKKTAH